MSNLLTSEINISLDLIFEHKLQFLNDEELIKFASKFTAEQITSANFKYCNNYGGAILKDLFEVTDLKPLGRYGPINKTEQNKIIKKIELQSIKE